MKRYDIWLRVNKHILLIGIDIQLWLFVSFNVSIPIRVFRITRAERSPANGELVHHETMRSSALSHFYFGDGKLKNHVSVSLTSGALHVLSLAHVVVMVADLIGEGDASRMARNTCGCRVKISHRCGAAIKSRNCTNRNVESSRKSRRVTRCDSYAILLRKYGIKVIARWCNTPLLRSGHYRCERTICNARV